VALAVGPRQLLAQQLVQRLVGGLEPGVGVEDPGHGEGVGRVVGHQPPQQLQQCPPSVVRRAEGLVDLLLAVGHEAVDVEQDERVDVLHRRQLLEARVLPGLLLVAAFLFLEPQGLHRGRHAGPKARVEDQRCEVGPALQERRALRVVSAVPELPAAPVVEQDLVGIVVAVGTVGAAFAAGVVLRV
jgi:hypothetical protein